MFRLRYDNAQGMNRPDRAEYFYGAWQELSFHPHGIQHGGVFIDANARGPIQLPSEVSFQEPSAYLEYAFSKRFSAFADVPLRFVTFRGLQEDTSGVRDETEPGQISPILVLVERINFSLSRERKTMVSRRPITPASPTSNSASSMP